MYMKFGPRDNSTKNPFCGGKKVKEDFKNIELRDFRNKIILRKCNLTIYLIIALWVTLNKLKLFVYLWCYFTSFIFGFINSLIVQFAVQTGTKLQYSPEGLQSGFWSSSPVL